MDLLGEPGVSGVTLDGGGGEGVWELDFVVLSVDHVEVSLASQVFVLDDFELDDLDVLITSVVLTSHLREHLGHGTSGSGFTNFAIHVVVTDLVSVSDLDAIVLDGGVFFSHSLDGDGLAVSLFDLLELVDVIPEAGLSNDFVWSEDGHLEDLWVWLDLAWEFTTENNVLLHVTRKEWWMGSRLFIPNEIASGALSASVHMYSLQKWKDTHRYLHSLFS